MRVIMTPLHQDLRMIQVRPWGLSVGTLARDSYSGDALYEFYEPDDSLENSPPGDDCLYDLHGHSSEMFDPFLNLEPFSSPATWSNGDRGRTASGHPETVAIGSLQREQREARKHVPKRLTPERPMLRGPHPGSLCQRGPTSRPTPGRPVAKRSVVERLKSERPRCGRRSPS